MPTRLPFLASSMLAVLAALCVEGRTMAADTAEAQWRTAFVKRGFVGAFQNTWLKGPGSVIRSRTPMPFTGMRVKVLAVGTYGKEVVLDHLSLIAGTDDVGSTAGAAHPILFDGKPSVTFTTATEQWSDETAIPMTVGTWYVQDSYRGELMPYAYDVDNGFCGPAGSDGDVHLPGIITGSRAGVVTRIEVLTTDLRPGIVCFGDSITHGFKATPNCGKRYPDQLAGLLDRPVLNLGVNGDVIQYSGGAPSLITSLKGIDTVVFLLGINDLIGGSITSVEAYATRATAVIAGVKGHGLKIYIGTLLPASGYADYDKKLPAIEVLRQQINTWIRTSSGATGVIDFDRGLADPQTPGRMRSALQSDWLHPDDAGYRVMAETAATVLRQ